MKTKIKVLRPVALEALPELPGTTPPPPLSDTRQGLLLPAKAAQHQSDPGHRFHGPARPSDSRVTVAASGEVKRVRARLPEFHKKSTGVAGPQAATLRPRKIHGGLVSKRRAGK